MHLCEVGSECDVDCVCVQRVSGICTSSNIITAGLNWGTNYRYLWSFGRFRKVITFINSCNPWHRALKGCSGYVWIYRKCHRVALHVICGRHLVALEPFVSGRGLLATYNIKIHSHERCKKKQQTVRT